MIYKIWDWFPIETKALAPPTANTKLKLILDFRLWIGA